ncbi:hypothetical protein FQA39_LY14380 [Lamprigera yunnana]|nr:hypothetical protein FQA39_LY14380 [Lamprigera yunnana]
MGDAEMDFLEFVDTEEDVVILNFNIRLNIPKTEVFRLKRIVKQWFLPVVLADHRESETFFVVFDSGSSLSYVVKDKATTLCLLGYKPTKVVPFFAESAHSDTTTISEVFVIPLYLGKRKFIFQFFHLPSLSVSLLFSLDDITKSKVCTNSHLDTWWFEDEPQNEFKFLLNVPDCHNQPSFVAQSGTIESPTIDLSDIQNLAHDMNVCTQLTICFQDDQQSAPGSAIIFSRNERSPGWDIDEAVLMIDQPSTSSLIPVLTRIDQPTTSGLNLPSPFKRALLWPQPVQLRSTKRREKLPAVVTSPQMLEYYIKRDDKKRAAEKQKEDRKLLRKAKRKESQAKTKEREDKKQQKLNSKRKRNNSSSSSSHSQSDFSLQESGDSELELAISDDGNEGEKVSLDELKEGTFVFAKFKGGKRNLTVFVYLSVIQELREDGNIVVMGLKNTDSEKKDYVAEEKDICEINLKEIVRLVEEPELIVKGERVSYRFKNL